MKKTFTFLTTLLLFTSFMLTSGCFSSSDDNDVCQCEQCICENGCSCCCSDCHCLNCDA